MLKRISEENAMEQKQAIETARKNFKKLEIFNKKGYAASVEKKPPIITIDKKTGIYFSTAAIRLMGEPAWVNIYSDIENKQLALEAMNEVSENTIPFVTKEKREKLSKGKQIIIKWTKENILHSVYEMLGEVPECKTIVPLKYEKDADWFVLDFTQTQTRRKKNV